ncbi:MAG: DNA polymerase III subunit delta [Candidatus Competibacteraceae bacterium]|nr:DNA polymerase III subunit delta [Candidatus Competibacteraceae bacterium]
MRLRPEQLAGHLRKSLAPAYLVFGEEPLQSLEAADAIRAAARARGHSERDCLTVEAGFDWSALARRAASLSLLAERRLLELRLGDAKPGEAGARALEAYAARPAEDAVLLVTAGKLDWATQKSRWFAALDGAGAVVAALPVEPRQLPGWIERRLRARGLNPAPDAVALLAERVEGNLLAAAQDIEKLALLAEGSALAAEAVLAVVDDSARYSIYDFADAGLLGQPERTARILNGLREEGVEPVLINWALHQDIRRLVALAFARERGQSLEPVLAEQKVWEKRKPLLRQALQRLSATDCRALLRACARTDRTIKGVETGSPWDELRANGLRLAGVELVSETV